MTSLKPYGQRPPHGWRYQEWKANMILRHAWFRILLHLEAIALCPRNLRWHWDHILGEFQRSPGGPDH